MKSQYIYDPDLKEFRGRSPHTASVPTPIPSLPSSDAESFKHRQERRKKLLWLLSLVLFFVWLGLVGIWLRHIPGGLDELIKVRLTLPKVSVESPILDSGGTK